MAYKATIELMIPVSSEESATRWTWIVKELLDSYGYLSSIKTIEEDKIFPTVVKIIKEPKK